MTDADDSIVLDDLVRTAEASRLRRRGAIRLADILSWDDDSDDDDVENAARRPRYTYSLFCATASTSSPFTPSILPLSATPLPTPPTNRCATLLHVSAAPRRHLWHALSAGASPSLVPLDPVYIDDPAPLGLHTAPCGCTREAVACAVCGNLLGTRFSSCPISSHAHSRSNSYEYTFLSAAVTSVPVYSPAPTSTSTTPQPQLQPQLQTYPPLFDRLITASPTPLTDEERTAYYRTRPTPAAQPRYSYGYGYGGSLANGNSNAYGSVLGYGYGHGHSGDLSAGVVYEGTERYNADGEIVRREPAGEGEGEEDEAGMDKAGEGMFVPER